MTDFLPTRRQFGTAILAGGVASAMINRRASAQSAKRARVFVPPLNANWTSGYELIEIADLGASELEFDRIDERIYLLGCSGGGDRCNDGGLKPEPVHRHRLQNMQTGTCCA